MVSPAHSALLPVPAKKPFRRRNPGVLPNRSKVGVCVMPYDFCSRSYGSGLGPVTAHPTAAWVARQITEAFPWDTAPR